MNLTPLQSRCVMLIHGADKVESVAHCRGLIVLGFYGGASLRWFAPLSRSD
jgi:hypothetical protein